ncbi:MAG TPA: hypothetical protein VM884_01645 [Flavisolibacter sp.]|nr:hypothetical protein [Flavisolibacter sp.]
MTQKPTIQKTLASLLLVFFSISFIPKSFFHDAMADHTDAATCNYSAEKLCVHQKGFSCSFNELVVTSPYDLLIATFSLVQPYIYAANTGRYYSLRLQQQFFATESRGPPFSGT